MSTNEELHPPPKPRASPLDYRNTDLVSRLLAATPPYLYNMPMVPNSYFFSEMLRSFVQAKTDANRAPPIQHHRRSRKRSWTQGRGEYYNQKESPKMEKPDIPSANWNQKLIPMNEKTSYYDTKRPDIPLELTIEKHPNKPSELDYSSPKLIPQTPNIHHPIEKPPQHMPMMFPNISQNHPQQEPNQNVILPPPPPIWYPPLYPAPYGIDPLHFFIDLRVSGHIYDRKNAKEAQTSPQTIDVTTNEKVEPPKEGFKQSRHASAFSVPIPSTKNAPINLSSNKEEYKPMKFDVKSMGFEKSSNKASTNYVMTNIGRIYKELNEEVIVDYKEEPVETNSIQEETKTAEGIPKEETEEEREKRVKDLRALIGLELVVDYMNHAKPGQPVPTSEESTSENESAPSPTLEVVALQDEMAQGY